MSGHWADKYVGLPAEGRWPCWSLVRQVWQNELGFVLPTFEEQAMPEDAIAIGHRDFVPVMPGAHQPFDAVMMYVPRATRVGSYRRVEAHIGVIVKDSKVLHVHLGCTSSIDPLRELGVSRIIRGPWKVKS